LAPVQPFIARSPPQALRGGALNLWVSLRGRVKPAGNAVIWKSETGAKPPIFGCGAAKPALKTDQKRQAEMKLIVKLLFALVILGLIGLTGYAYLGDLSPEQRQIEQPVVLDGQ
jgi:hypothetical protein